MKTFVKILISIVLVAALFITGYLLFFKDKTGSDVDQATDKGSYEYYLENHTEAEETTEDNVIPFK